MSFNLPILPKDWTYAPLDSLCKQNSVTYGVVQPGSALDHGIPLIRVNNFRDTHIDLSDVMYIDPTIESKYTRTRLQGGEVLITVVGSVGQVAIVSDKFIGFNVARAVAVIHPLAHIPSEWIALCLRSPLSKHLLASRANTTVQTTINLKDLRALPIPIPPESERMNISDFIGVVDDCITTLRESNATLEALAQAIFKSWFVDFYPVHAKMEGRVPDGMDAATAALFPDSFEESELGLIPKGWHVSNIGKAFILTMGQSPPGDTYNESGAGLPFYQGRTDFGIRFPTQRMFCTAPNRIAEAGDTLVSVRAPVGDVNMAIEKCCLGRGVAGIRHPLGFGSFVFYSAQALRIRFKVFDTEGTVFGSINKKDFQELPVVEPDIAIYKAFNNFSSIINDQVVENEKEIRTLATLRDTLLPRLISGQLRIPESPNELQT